MTHQQAADQLSSGIPAELICATCPWDRLCVKPPTVSSAEIDRRMKEAEQQDDTRDPMQSKMPVATLLTVLTFAGKDKLGELCPVFAARLTGPDGRLVADGIRAQMRDWKGGE